MDITSLSDRRDMDGTVIARFLGMCKGQGLDLPKPRIVLLVVDYY